MRHAPTYKAHQTRAIPKTVYVHLDFSRATAAFAQLCGHSAKACLKQCEFVRLCFMSIAT